MYVCLSVCLCVCMLVPATVVNSGVVDVVEVIENHTVYLVCPAQGIPTPSIIWLRDNIPMLMGDDDDDDDDDDMMTGKVRAMSSGRQLELRQVRVDDEAIYQCRATNVAGQQDKRFRLRVLGKPDHL